MIRSNHFLYKKIKILNITIALLNRHFKKLKPHMIVQIRILNHNRNIYLIKKNRNNLKILQIKYIRKHKIIYSIVKNLISKEDN